MSICIYLARTEEEELVAKSVFDTPKFALCTSERRVQTHCIILFGLYPFQNFALLLVFPDCEQLKQGAFLQASHAAHCGCLLHKLNNEVAADRQYLRVLFSTCCSASACCALWAIKDQVRTLSPSADNGTLYSIYICLHLLTNSLLSQILTHQSDKHWRTKFNSIITVIYATIPPIRAALPKFAATMQ